MGRLLILHSTVDGHTRRICLRIGERVQARGHQVRALPLPEADTGTLADCDAVVIGASIRYGHHRPDVAAFVERHRRTLQDMPSAFFSVNLVARKPGRDSPGTNPYCRRFLLATRWQPRLAGVFAGRLDYPRYSGFDRAVIRLIMKLTGGPTDPRLVVEFTDWQRVDAFADEIGGWLGPPETPP